MGIIITLLKRKLNLMKTNLGIVSFFIAVALKLSSTDPAFPKNQEDVPDYVDEYIQGLIQRQEKVPVPEESIYRSKNASFEPIIKPKKEKFQLKPGSTEEEEENQRMMFDIEERRKEEDYIRAVADQKKNLAIYEQEAASYGLKKAVMSIVEYRQLKPDHNPLPNSPLYNDLFKRTKRENNDGDYENEDDDDSDESDVNEHVAEQMVYEERRKRELQRKPRVRSEVDQLVLEVLQNLQRKRLREREKESKRKRIRKWLKMAQKTLLMNLF